MKNTAKIAAAIVTLLLVSSALIVFATDDYDSTATAQTLEELYAERVNPVTGKVYGDMDQYIWPTIAAAFGTGNDETYAHSSGGPAPSTPTILWSMAQSGNFGEAAEVFGDTPQDRTSDLGHVERGTPDMLVGGYAFVRSVKGTITGYAAASMFASGGEPQFAAGATYWVNALDPYTGDLVYQIQNPGTGAPAVVDGDGEYFRLTFTGGWAVYETATGRNVYNVTPAPTGTLLPNLGISVSSITGTNDSYTTLIAWDRSETLSPTGSAVRTAYNNESDALWKVDQDMGGSGMGGFNYLAADIDNGVLFYGSSVHRNVWGINATDGTILWMHDSKGTSRNALYYDGMFIHHGLQHGVTAYNSTTGEVIWEWVGGSRTYFGNAGAAGDGLFFAHAIDTPTGWYGCWDAYTGEMLWKVPGYFYIGYFSPCYDDGKLYCILADNRGTGGTFTTYNYWTGKGATEDNQLSACIDVITGEIIWTMPFQIGHNIGAYVGSFDSHNYIAYGILWVERYNVLYAIGDAETESWSNFHGSETQNAVKTTRGPLDLNYPAWTFTTGGSVSAVPAVADGKLYIGSHDHMLYCLDAYTGEKIWNFTTGWQIYSSVAVADGRVFTGTDDGDMYCLDADTGEVIWTKDWNAEWLGSLEFYPGATTAAIRSSPLVVGSMVYVGDLSGKFHCLNVASGSEVWSYQTYGPILSSPMYYNGVVYIASTDINFGANGRLYAFDASTGSFKWAATVADSGREGPVNTPVLYNEPNLGAIILMGNTAASANAVQAYNITDGSLLNFYNSTTQFKLNPGAGTLGAMFGTGAPMWWDTAALNQYVAGYKSLSTLVWDIYNETATNRVMWTNWLNHNGAGTPTVSASMQGTIVYYSSDAGTVSVQDIATGNVLSNFIGMGQAANGVALWEGKLYFGHGDRNVYCFSDIPTMDLTVSATQNKGAAMWNNETLSISGRLYATPTYDIPAIEATGTGPIYQVYYSGIPNSTVNLVFVKPDGNTETVTATTNRTGYFTAQFSPADVGNWSWVAWYEGMIAPNDAYRYNEAYSGYTTFAVEAPPTSETDGNDGSGGSLPMEYVYAAIAAVVIVIVAIGAYFLLKRKK